MNNWSIHKQIVVLALLPALFVGLCLAAYFTYSQLEYISDSLQEHGQSIVTQIAPACEYGIFSGNTNILLPTLKNALNDQDVVAVTVKDHDNTILISLSDETTQPPTRSVWRNLIKTEHLNFSAPITSQEVAIEDFSDNQLATPGNRNPIKKIIGYVDLVVTTHFSDARKFDSLNKGIMLTAAILLASFIVAARVSKRIATPVIMLTDTVSKIASGDFKTRVKQDAAGELGVLESYVNKMADELQSYHEDMESRINDFTRELQTTLEELEIRNAELDITRSNALAANRAKSEFLANMSHEIRTPLAGIIGFSELLDNTSLEERQKDFVTTIRKSSGILLNIIDDILDLSKIESGKLEISMVEFNLLNVIEETIDLMSPVAYDKNVELLYNLHSDVPRNIEADPVRIRQVLLNLIGNAIKFTEKGYVYLEIENAPEISQNGIRFTVIDTGIGMSPSSKQTLFNAFTQADTSITRRFGGTGLGLVISRKLTLLMKGTIDFDSVKDEGSRFWFRVPVNIKTHDTTDVEDKLRGLRINLVSGNDIFSNSVRSMLENWQCRIKTRDMSEYQGETFDQGDADLTLCCLSLDDLTQMKAGELNHCKLVKGHPSLAVISSNNQADIDQVQSCCATRTVFFSSPQKHIYNTLCNLLDVSSRASSHPVAMPADNSSTDWSDISILVVDDNAINLHLAEIILQQYGAEVVAVASGDEAVKLAGLRAFDIIFMDLHMPGLDGYSTTKRIRVNSPGIPPVIIALTANAMPTEKARIYECGMNDIMIKPISEQMMNEVISRWFRNPGNTQTIDAPPPDDDVFSIEEANKFTAGNTALAMELFNMLKHELPDYQSSIAAAVKSHDYAELKTHVHKLHGATRCCGTPALQKAAANMERVIDSQQHDEFDAAASRLDREITRLLAYGVNH